MHHTMVQSPMTRAHLDEFVECYCSGHMEDRKQTYSEENPNGRWRRFTEEEVKGRDDLNFKWIDLTEEDERTIDEVLADMQEEANAISASVEQLKILLGGIES